MLDWLGSFKKKPKKVFLVHGEEEALKTLSSLIQDQLEIPNEIPVLGQAIELTAAEDRKIVAERPKISKDRVMKTLNALRNDMAKTLENTEYRLSEDDYVKIDALMYMLEKLQDNITELKKEIS